MTNRVLVGKKGSLYGFWVSKPGFDVTTADVMQLAYSSDVALLNLVAKGSISISPQSAVAPFGNGTRFGAKSAGQTVGYGRTINPVPFVAAIGTASSWPLPLNASSRTQYTTFNSQWISFVSEQPPFAQENYGGQLIKRASPPSTNGDVDPTWSSILFIANVYSTGVDFFCNCENTVTIRYLIMEKR